MKFAGWGMLTLAVLCASYGMLGLPRECLAGHVAGSLYKAACDYPILGVLYGLFAGRLTAARE